jgi:hypothetical protein
MASHEAVLEVAERGWLSNTVDGGGSLSTCLVHAVRVLGGEFASAIGAVVLAVVSLSMKEA